MSAFTTIRFAHAATQDICYRARGGSEGSYDYEHSEVATSRCDVQLQLLTDHCMSPT
jgi:hypothetical protein